MPKKAVVVLANGFEEIEALTVVDVLRRAGVEVVVAGVGGMNITAAHGVVCVADTQLEKLTGEFDCVVYPGGMPGSKNLGESAAAKELAEKMLAAGKLVAAICAAPVFTLGAWGMLHNRTVTCFQGMETMFPPTVVFSPGRLVKDGNIVTSRAPGTTMEFALFLAGELAGAGVSAQLAKDMMVK